MNTKNISEHYRSFTIARNRTANFFATSPRYDLPLSRHFTNNKALIYILAIALLVAVSFFVGKSFNNGSNNQISAPAPIATQNLNKDYKFPLKDSSGKEVAKISYFIESADLQNSFIYQGKLATAVKGRQFLIFDLKITNPYSKTIQINAKDYIRVKLNGSDEQLAPEIHNDPVEIQAKSTKYTRIGLPINTTDKNIVVLVGELQGSNKDSFKLSLAK